jgi:hypothetical protein
VEEEVLCRAQRSRRRSESADVVVGGERGRLVRVAILDVDLGHAVGGTRGSGGHGGGGVLRGAIADWETHGVSWMRDNKRRVSGVRKRGQKRLLSLLGALEDSTVTGGPRKEWKEVSENEMGFQWDLHWTDQDAG